MTIGTLTALILISVFSIMQTPLEYILLSYVIGNIISAVISLHVIKENIKPFSLNPDFIAKILKNSLPLGRMLFFNLIFAQISLSFHSSKIQ